MKTAIEIRRFNSNGIEAYNNLLLNRPVGLFDQLEEIQKDANLTSTIGVSFEWDDEWTTRLQLAKSLWKAREKFPQFDRAADDDMVWNWISCRLFSALHNYDEKTATNLKAKSESTVRWIVEENKLRQHRHLILGPYTAYKNNFSFGTDYALSQLVQPILLPGEVVERIAGKIELSSGEVALLATWLYVDRSQNKIRDGITKKGSPQQLSKYFNQIAKTVDYQSMTAKELLKLLPNHFEHWVKLAKAEWVS